MIRRNQLVQIDPAGQKQETGALMRSYRAAFLKQKHLQEPPRGTASHATLERLARLRGDDLALEETQLIPHAEALYLPRILRYREVNKPLELLYAAVIEAIRRLDAIPDMLFISASRLPELKQETERIQQRKFDDYFVYYSGYGKLEYIPVYTTETLPEVLRYAIAQETINRDEVIAVVNCPPARHHLTA